MKICPSCSARLGDDVSVCSSCEYRFDAGDGKIDSGVKKTMMGLPALTDYGAMGKGAGSRANALAPAGSKVGSTLFGLPALNFADAFSEASEASEDATSMISAKDLKTALESGEHLAAVIEGAKKDGVGGVGGDSSDNSKVTSFGMRAPTLEELHKTSYDDSTDDSTDDLFGGEFVDGIAESMRERLSGAQASEVSAALRGWGLDEFSEEIRQETQVLGSEVLQRGFGGAGRDAQAIGFDAEDYSGSKHTIMGMQIDSDLLLNAANQRGSLTDATRSVSPDDLFGAKSVLDADGLPENIRDQVRGEMLARQTTSLNVPSISSTPASGLVRARTDSGQPLRAMMDTPVMYSDDVVGGETSVVDVETLRDAPASGVFKKLKRRLAAESAESNAGNTDGADLGGVGRYQVSSGSEPTISVREDSDVGTSKPAVSADSTLSSMADELASIPLMSDTFGGDAAFLDPVFSDPFGEVGRAVVEEQEKVTAAVSEQMVEPLVERLPAPVVVAASTQVVAAEEVVVSKEKVQEEKPRMVVAMQAANEITKSSDRELAAEKGMNKGILVGVLIGLLVLGVIVVFFLK